MVISKDSQLGLRFKDNSVKVEALQLLETQITTHVDKIKESIPVLKERQRVLEENKKRYAETGTLNEEEIIAEMAKYILPEVKEDMRLSLDDKVKPFCDIEKMYGENEDTKYFLIQSSVYKAADLIRIGENFTGRILRNIKFGWYVYLMGKHQMVKFVVVDRGIKGIYYDDKQQVTFEWGIEMESGEYFYTYNKHKEFSTIMQLLTFIELGDIEVKVLRGLGNNGEKKDKKVYNASLNTVYVVDSSWNQLIIRTEGFAVRGHFRLQPCGEGMADRKLIWINAFEKDGYIRRPKASIIK